MTSFLTFLRTGLFIPPVQRCRRWNICAGGLFLFNSFRLDDIRALHAHSFMYSRTLKMGKLRRLLSDHGRHLILHISTPVCPVLLLVSCTLGCVTGYILKQNRIKKKKSFLWLSKNTDLCEKKAVGWVLTEKSPQRMDMLSLLFAHVLEIRMCKSSMEIPSHTHGASAVFAAQH